MKKYEVTVVGTAWQNITVEAEDEAEAAKIAMREADAFECEIEFHDIDNVVEIDDDEVTDDSDDLDGEPDAESGWTL